MHGEFYTFECAKRLFNSSIKPSASESLDYIWKKVYENCTEDLTQVYIASQNTCEIKLRQQMLLKLAEESVRQ